MYLSKVQKFLKSQVNSPKRKKETKYTKHPQLTEKNETVVLIIHL